VSDISHGAMLGLSLIFLIAAVLIVIGLVVGRDDDFRDTCRKAGGVPLITRYGDRLCFRKDMLVEVR